MDAKTIKSTKEFIRAVELVVNQYANDVPADIMSVIFSNLIYKAEKLADAQYKEALKVLAEHEKKQSTEVFKPTNNESEVKQNASDLQKDN